MNPETVDKIKSLAEEVCQREGCYLYDVDFSGNIKHRVLRVFVDSDSAPVTIDQCANVSQGLSLLLDVQDLVPGGAYELEVSSPGLERQLRQQWHFKKSVGQKIKVVLQSPLPGAEKQGTALAGVLQQASDNAIVLQSKGSDLEIPYPLIKRAQTVFELKQDNKR